MKVATYNVNGVNGRLPVLLRWLEKSGPDVVVLQELKAPQDKFPEKAIRDLGYDAIWHGQKSWNGVALLSRVGEIHETRRGLPDDPDSSQSRYIEAAVNGTVDPPHAGLAERRHLLEEAGGDLGRCIVRVDQDSELPEALRFFSHATLI